MSFFERRGSPRLPAQSQGFVLSGTTALAVSGEDFSRGGCRLLRPRGWDLNIGDVLMFYVFSGPGPAMSIEARVAWFREDYVGLEFLNR